MPSLGPRTTQKLVAALLTSAALACAAFFANWTQKNHRLTEAYNQSPRTSGTADSRRTVSARIQRLFQEQAGRGQRCMVQLTADDGTSLRAQIPSREPWEQLREGASTTAEVWRGEVTLLGDQPTSANPPWQEENVRTGGMVLTGMLGVVALAAVAWVMFGPSPDQED